MANEVKQHRQAGLAILLLLLRPFLTFVATLVGASFVASALLYFAPGNAADVIATDPKTYAGLVEKWGLDDSLLTQYVTFLSNALQGDFGVSLATNQGEPVLDLIQARAGRTIGLVGGAIFLAFGLGLLLALCTAGTKSRLESWKTWPPALVRRGVQILSILPVFLAAYICMYSIDASVYNQTVANGLTPPSWFPLLLNTSFIKTGLGITVLAVSSCSLTEIHSACENELSRIQESEFIDAARARGDRLWPHVLSALVPTLTTLVSSRVAFFLGGTVIVEEILHINGVGRLFWDACLDRDFPLVLGITVLSATIVCTARLLGDWIRIWTDPRQRGGA